MSIVTRPFVLDFAGAYLDQAPDFSEEVLAEWEAEKQEQFGAQWPRARAILRSLESFGIFMIDVSPNNVSLSGRAGYGLGCTTELAQTNPASGCHPSGGGFDLSFGE